MINECRREGTAWRDISVASSGERLLRIGLMIALAALGGECFKRARRGRE